jgi:molybdopterin converting factor small subunit
MQVRVKLMGMLRGKLPIGSELLDLNPGTSISALLERIGVAGGQVHLVILNGDMVTDRQQILADGDELTVFPPVAGGGDGEGRPSPGWVLLLVLLVHGELWLAFGATIVSLVHLANTGQAFGIGMPYTTELVAGFAAAIMTFPPVLVLFPLLDAVVLLILHRVASSPAARVAWSVFVAGFLLVLLVWGSAGHGMMLRKLREAHERQPAPAQQQ